MTAVRVAFPAHLRTLAHIDGEVVLAAEPSLGGVLTAIEARFPVLRGTRRDTVTLKRRAFVRFYAAGEDLSHCDTAEPLPAAVIAGSEPFLVIGAMAGG